MVKTVRRSSVFSVLRRGSKDGSSSSLSTTTKSTENKTVIAPAPRLSSSADAPSRLGFFDLPAELRNGIYAFIVCDAILTLPGVTATPSWKPSQTFKRGKAIPLQVPINGLLLASKRCRREYMAVQLSTMEVNINVRDFDFRALMRVSSSLDEMESRALHANHNLVIVLDTRNCTTKGLLSLRRWLDFRRDRTNDLAWTYEFPLLKLLPTHVTGRTRLLRELEYYADAISTLEVDLDVTQQQELKRIVEAFETHIRWLDNDIGWLGQQSTNVARNARGLMGGGLR